MALRRSKTGGGVGTNQYGVVGASVGDRQAAAARNATRAATLDGDTPDDFMDWSVIANAYKETLTDPVPDRPYNDARTSTPWGASNGRYRYGFGVSFYSCPGHGGFKVSDGMLAQMPPELAAIGDNGWFEEDCDWAAVAAAFPRMFTADELDAAFQSLRDYHPDAFEAWSGETCDPSNSHLRAKEAFTRDHRNDHVATAAISGRGHFGQRTDADNQSWSAAFDKVTGQRSGTASLNDMFIEIRNEALRNGALGGNDKLANEQHMVQHHLANIATVTGDTVNFDARPHGDLPVVRDIPDGMVKVFTRRGGAYGGGGDHPDEGQLGWLVSKERYAARGQFGFVVDPAVDTQIAPI
jgi:hypothetical protein